MRSLSAVLSLLAIAVLVTGCGRRSSVAGDVYAMRLAIEDFQTYTQAADEAHSAQLRGLRASTDLHAEDLERRLDNLEREIALMKAAIERLNGTQEPPRIRHQLIVPPDPESRGSNLTPSTLTPPPPPTPPNEPFSNENL